MKGRLIKRESNYYLFVEGKPFGTTDDLYIQYEIVSNLSKQNCDEIFGVVDVEKLAEDDWDIYGEQFKNTPIWDYKEIFVAGFNKAMELYQPTEIEVEIEVEAVNYCDCKCHTDGVTMHFMPCCNPDIVPKLDDNNNLILRRWS
jgi:hypothetical protein